MVVVVVIVSRGRDVNKSVIVTAVIVTEATGTVIRTCTDIDHVDTDLGLHRRIIAVRIGVGEMTGTIVMIVIGGTEIAGTVIDAKTVDVNDPKTNGTAETAIVVLRANTVIMMTDTTTILVTTRIVDVHPLLVGTVVLLLTD